MKTTKKVSKKGKLKRYLYFPGLTVDTKTMESINPDKSRKPLSAKAKAMVRKYLKNRS